MTDKSVPKEVIVVEGRDDSKRLMEVYGNQIKTIETRGSAIDEATIERIRKAQDQYGVIVFTDPDFQGNRIRQMIKQAVPDARHAYLSQNEARGKRVSDSLGIEHADNKAIIKALEKVQTPKTAESVDPIPLAQLMIWGLVGHPAAKIKRQKVADHFNLGHLNGKQLQQELVRYQITYNQLTEFLEEEGLISNQNNQG